MIWPVLILAAIGVGVIISELHLPSLELKEEGPGLFLWGPICLAIAFFISLGAAYKMHFSSYVVITVVTGVLWIISLTLSWVHGKGITPAFMVFMIPLIPFIFLYMSYTFFVNEDKSNMKSAIIKGIILDIAVIAVVVGIYFFSCWVEDCIGGR